MNIFGVTVKTSVDSVLSAFRQTISDLQEVHTHHIDKAARHEAEIAEATQNRDASAAEATRAASAIQQFEKLLGNI
jgi:hypothetical protein